MTLLHANRVLQGKETRYGNRHLRRPLLCSYLCPSSYSPRLLKSLV
jgi:hypothetical protein